MQRFTKSLIPLLLFLALLSFNGVLSAASTTLVINEIDYDQPSTDTTEYLEIKNVSVFAINLDAYSVVLINGTGGGAAPYATVDLPNVNLAAGDYYVICGGLVVNCDLDLTPDTNFIQNGTSDATISPDAVGLRLNSDLIDAVSYEGNTGAPYTETSGVGLVDNAVGVTSISRCADGKDTDVNNVDFLLRASTPGTANDCPSTDNPAALKINEVDYDQASIDAAEFVEFKNVTNAPINLDNYVVELVNGNGGAVYQSIDLPAVSLAANDYYVICGIPANVPSCDLDYSPDTDLIQNGAPDAIGLRLNGSLVDALSYEGSVPAYTEGTGTSLADTDAAGIGLSRCEDGADTNNNSADFLLRPISPGSTNSCPSGVPIVEIWEIQGAAHLSPYNTQTVQTNDNIVTAVRSNGFYIQTPDARIDANNATSNAILVFTSSAPSVLVGQQVDVRGTVTEFRPGGLADGGLTITELTSPVVTVDSSGNALPAATVIGIGGRIPPSAVINDDGTGNIETSGTFDADFDGIDFYESLEAMRVQVNNAMVVGATNNFGETWVVADNGANASLITPRGGILISPGDFNPERIQLDDTLYPGAYPQLNVGDKLTSAAIGVLDYGFGNFELLVTDVFTTAAGTLAPEVTSLQGNEYDLTIATFNVENLAGNADPGAYTSRAAQIVTNLGSPDILVLEEIQDNNGVTNDSITDASTTLNHLINAIVLAGGPSYQFQQIDPADDQDGGAPGGNIRVGFLYNPSRVSFVSRGSASSLTANSVLCGANGAELQYSPGRIDPTNSAFNASRKPLAGEFVFNGETVFVIGLHFNSKGGDNPLFGFNQPPVLNSEVQRLQQAQIVNNFVDNILACEPAANIVVLGDVNDFDFSPVTATLSGGVLQSLMNVLPANERYSYVFDGNSQVLDQILVSSNVYSNLLSYDVLHVNAEFRVQVSDHDPSVMLARFNSAPVATNDSYLTDEDLPLNVPAAGVLSNDSDVNGDGLTAALVSTTSNGLLNLSTDGSFSYTPNANFNGADSFSYQVCDPLIRCSIGTVLITVNPVNDQAAVSVGQAEVSVVEGSVATNTIQASDIDGDVLIVSASLGTVTDNGNGTWNWEFLTSDGPAQSQSVLITVDDAHGGGNQTSFSLIVTNVAPTANAGADQTVFRNAPVSLSGTWTDPAASADDLYSWTWDTNGDSLADSSGTATYGTTVPASTSFALEGSYALTFSVTDKDGSVSSDTVLITVVNQAPNCSTAVPSATSLRPPNHTMTPISILGVTDPEGDAITIGISSIFQDEPTNGVDDGDTSPDGAGIGTNTASVRAERAGTGNGRVYHISFIANDGHGGTCSGQVLVTVNDSQGNNGTAIDDGALYDSTLP